MKLRLPLLAVLSALAWQVALKSQSVFEYAQKGSPSTDSGPNAIAGCPVDSSMLTCLSRLYPTATIITAVVIALLLLNFFMRRKTR